MIERKGKRIAKGLGVSFMNDSQEMEKKASLQKIQLEALVVSSTERKEQEQHSMNQSLKRKPSLTSNKGHKNEDGSNMRKLR